MRRWPLLWPQWWKIVVDLRTSFAISIEEGISVRIMIVIAREKEIRNGGGCVKEIGIDVGGIGAEVKW